MPDTRPSPDRRILVTGGLGYVGSRLVPRLLEGGYAVRVLDLALYGEAGLEALRADSRWEDWRRRFDWIRGDVRDPSAVAEAVRGVDTVIHLAAISNDPTGEIDDALTRQVNFDAVGLLIALARKAGVRQLVNASSSSVFGARDEQDIVESLEPRPITTYSRYKMLSEWLVVAANSADFVTTNVRPATICGYSPRQRFDLTVNKLTADAIRKGVITVHGGQQRRPNVSMADAVELYTRLLTADPKAIAGRTFNFGFENHRIIDIAHIIREELADLGVRIERTEVFDERDYHISSHSLVRTLGYEPIGSIASAVAELRHRMLDVGDFPDPDAPEHHNLRSMKLDRLEGPYFFLSGDAPLPA